jgi:processing peptidase subunit beta
MAESAFGNVPAGTGASITAEAPYFCGAELIYRNDEMGATAFVSVGYKTVPWLSGDSVAFMVMQHIIGSYKKNTGLVPGNISGNRTINAVANKMQVGCADEFEAFNCFYKDTGMFGWYAACDEVAVEHCIGELMFGVNLLSFSVTDEEVERGKRELKLALFGGSGSTADTCAEVGKQMLAYGRTVPAAEMILRIDAIDAEEIKRVAWQYLNDSEVAVTALGPLHGMPTYVDLRRSTTMHRY